YAESGCAVASTGPSLTAASRRCPDVSRGVGRRAARPVRVCPDTSARSAGCWMLSTASAGELCVGGLGRRVGVCDAGAAHWFLVPRADVLDFPVLIGVMVWVL